MLEGLERYLLRLRDGQFNREKRFAIQSRFSQEGQSLPFALNDIVFTKAPEQNLADFEIFCNGKLIDHYCADGVIFSTPTGSTAYALSAGGPVMDPALGAILMVPICPHSIAIRPMVFGGDKTITLRSGGSLQAVAAGADGAGGYRRHWTFPPGAGVCHLWGKRVLRNPDGENQTERLTPP